MAEGYRPGVEAQESWELEMAILCSKIVRLAALRKNKVGN
jgi:hypothetical protein